MPNVPQDSVRRATEDSPKTNKIVGKNRWTAKGSLDTNAIGDKAKKQSADLLSVENQTNRKSLPSVQKDAISEFKRFEPLEGLSGTLYHKPSLMIWVFVLK